MENEVHSLANLRMFVRWWQSGNSCRVAQLINLIVMICINVYHIFYMTSLPQNYLTLSLLSALFLRKKMNQFILKIHQICHMSFCMTFLTLLKLSYKNSGVNFDAFSSRIGSFFFSKTRRWEAKVYLTLQVYHFYL